MDPQYVPQGFIDRTAPPVPVDTMDAVVMVVAEIAYVAYVVYDDFSRPLDPEDVFLILSQLHKLCDHPCFFQEMFGKLRDDLWSFRWMFSKFDDPNDPITKRFADSFRTDPESLESCEDYVHRFFKDLKRTNTAVRDRSNFLAGVPERFPEPDLGPNPPPWDGDIIRVYQHAMIFCFIHFCRNHDGTALDDTYVKQLVKEKVFHGSDSLALILQTLRTWNDAVTVKVSRIVWPHRQPLARNAHQVHIGFTKERRLPDPKYIVPQWFDRYSVCQQKSLHE